MPENLAANPKMPNKEEMEKELNVLIRCNSKAAKAYELAAKHATNKNFNSFLEAYANRRQEFADELKSILNNQDLEINGKSKIVSHVEKGWMQLRLALPGATKDKSILKQCARFEKRTLMEYERLLKMNVLPQKIGEILLRQRDKILVTERSLSDISVLLVS